MFNSSNWIEETLTSIQKQTYGYFECIIIDDGSSDNSIKIVKDLIKTDPRFQLTERPKTLKKGPSSCRNYGCSLSTGTFIQFFDSDDIMHPNHLQEKRNAIQELDFVVCKIQEFHGNFNISLFEKETVPDILKYDNLFLAFVCGNFPFMMVAPMWRSEVLKKYLPFNENLHVLEDHELYSRILFESKTYAIVNKSLIYYRQSQTSSMNQFYANLETGMNSYLEAKKMVLQLSQTEVVKLAILKMVLGKMRMGLAQRNYSNAAKCFKFIKDQKLAYNFNLKKKVLRIKALYLIFQYFGRGDTHFKKMLKL